MFLHVTTSVPNITLQIPSSAEWDVRCGAVRSHRGHEQGTAVTIHTRGLCQDRLLCSIIPGLFIQVSENYG